MKDVDYGWKRRGRRTEELTVEFMRGVEHGGREGGCVGVWVCGGEEDGGGRRRVEGLFRVTKSDSNNVSVIGFLDRSEPQERCRGGGRVGEGRPVAYHDNRHFPIYR